MKKIYMILIVISICLSLDFFPVSALADDRVSAVAEFLIDRANDNYIYVLESRMKDNEAFKMYLPTTYNQIMYLDLKRVLQSNQKVWKKSIDGDLDGLKDKFIKYVKDDPNVIAINKIGNLIDVFEKSTLTIDGKSYQVKDLKDLPVNYKEIVDSTNVVASEVKDVKSKAEGIKIRQIVNIKDINGDNLSNKIEKVSDLEKKLILNKDKISGVKELLKITDQIKGFLIQTRDINDHIEIIISEEDVPYSIKVNSALYIIQYLVDTHGEDLFENKADYDRHQSSFEQFKQYALFFAQLADADTKNKDEIKAILKSYTMPSVSFATKREPRTVHITISSYLGMSAGLESINKTVNNDDNKYNFYYGLAAPVGLEFSVGTKDKHSASLLISPFDFGPAVNAQIYKKDDKIEVNDIVAPGVYLVHGVHNVPFAVGIGYLTTFRTSFTKIMVTTSFTNDL